MTEAVLVEVGPVLEALAQRRRVFHSEADFQFAFAWQAKVMNPDIEVRLETHPAPGIRLDVLFTDPASSRSMAVELKYLTREWAGSLDGEMFGLKNHGASDLRCYDVVKDVARVEAMVAANRGWSGACITITNDSSYWTPLNHQRLTNAGQFRIAEGRVLTGECAWGPNTEPGTLKGREKVIQIAGAHTLSWRAYATVDGSRAGTFRALVIEFPEVSAGY